MFVKRLKKSSINNVLIITLSNIGDVVLTWPVIDAVKETFENASISVVVGSGAQQIFDDNPYIHQVFAYDKKIGYRQKWKWIKHLRQKKYDLIIDLRNSVIPFLLRGKYKTWPILKKSTKHMRQKHLDRFLSIYPDGVADPVSGYGYALTDQLNQRAAGLLTNRQNFIVVAPGAKGGEKRWPIERFKEICLWLLKQKQTIVFLGDRRDAEKIEELLNGVDDQCCVNLAGKTCLNEVPAILKRAKVALLNDSGIMHMASYVNCPVVALFGPTDPTLYGPWGKESILLHLGDTMDAITVDDVKGKLEHVLR